jgi:parallel beta-helix repeat protein
MISKKKLKLYIKIGLAGLLIIALTFRVFDNGSAEIATKNKQHLASITYSTSGIVINDSNIASYSSSGTGTSGNPYIIDNLYINTTDYPVRFNGVSAGTYYELRDSHLIGRGTYGVYIHDITNGEASIINCTVEANLAIGGSNAKYLTIDNCTLRFSQGSTFREGLTFTNNIVEYIGSYSGSVMYIDDQDNLVENNIFYGNYSSFRVSRATNSIVRDNILIKSGFYFSTNDAVEVVTNTFENNTIDGRPAGYFVNRNNELISGEDYGQIYIVNSTNTIIENVTTNDINMGAQVHNCTDITLRNITVVGRDGIEVRDTKGIIIENSKLEGFYNGIDVDETEEIAFHNNQLTGYEYGIEIIYSSNVQITNNTLLQIMEHGFYLDNITNFEMTFNIVACDIQNPGSELAFYSWELGYADIYYNVFINYGNDSAQLMHEEGSTDVTWYDETLEIGNHYSDWNGTVPYTIPGDGNVDLYPFIDVDGDTLEEFDEVMIYHTNPFQADSDFDGLDDNEEINTYGTDPNNADSDGDGLLDGEEVNNYGTDPNNVDSDEDGYSDYEEVQAGTDPLDPEDYPKEAHLALILGLIFGLGVPLGVAVFLVWKGKIKLPFTKKK